MSLLRARDLRKSFGATEALLGASVSVDEGQVLAIMGPSGSGKSTLLHCLAGIMRPDSGDVTFAGADLASLPDKKLSRLRRNEFGFVFQFGQLVPELTLAENVSLPLTLSGTRAKAAHRKALAWLEKLDVVDLADRRPGDVSGGQQQRVAVARALVTEPRVVFADEPTGSLDSINAEHVMGLLVSSAAETGAAVVLVTHDVRVAAYSDHEIVVRDGRTRQEELVR